MSIAKQILIEELNENNHPENVADVIFWALEYYCENRKQGSWGGNDCLCDQAEDFRR